MAIKPVEYIKDSSTPGFAVAGDEKTITSSNANIIQKDVDQGNTEDLDSFQTNFLEARVDYDNLDYSEEEMEKVGEQQIDTEGEDGEDLSEKNQKTGSNVAIAAAATGAAATAAVCIGLGETKSGAGGWVGLAISIAQLAAAGTSLAFSIPSLFDPNLSERQSQTSKVGDNNTIMQQYVDKLLGDTESMEQDVATYSEISEMQTNDQVQTITELGALQAELQVYQSQGNSSKVTELKAQMEEIKKTSEENNKGPQEEMNGLKENINTYTGNNAEAQGVANSGSTVAEFLKLGEEFKTKANWTASLQLLAGVASALPVIPWTPWEIPASGLGAIASAAAALLFMTAASMMFSNAKKEGEAADAGEDLASNVENLQYNIDGQAGYTEATSGAYTETDTAATETVSENQEAANNANKGGAQGQRTTKPEENKPQNQQGDVAA